MSLRQSITQQVTPLNELPHPQQLETEISDNADRAMQ